MSSFFGSILKGFEAIAQYSAEQRKALEESAIEKYRLQISSMSNQELYDLVSGKSIKESAPVSEKAQLLKEYDVTSEKLKDSRRELIRLPDWKKSEIEPLKQDIESLEKKLEIISSLLKG